MKPRERVFKALQHQEPDRIPRFEIWIDALLEELRQDDPASAYVNLGQDCIMMPGQTPLGSNAWGDGVDEFGRIWKDGMYVEGAVDTEADLRRYSPSLDDVDLFFDRDRVRGVRDRYPDHCLIYGTHVGPFTAGYMAMGFARFFLRLADDPAFIHRLLEARTGWCIALYRQAISLGAEVLVLGDDAAHRKGPMISPRIWRELVLPYHRRIVDALALPVIWHSDGDIQSLLPMAIEAGFAGVHGLEPAAGVHLGQVKRAFGQDLVLVGNIDVGVLCASDPDAVRREVSRCAEQGAPGGGYMMATCNSIFEGMNPVSVAEMFRYEREVGFYS
jgi:uroporphyrinogen decarboxylase